VIDLAILVPSRGRPQNLDRLLFAVSRLTGVAVGKVAVFLGLDDDDDVDAYLRMPNVDGAASTGMLKVVTGPRQSLSEWTNQLAATAADTAHAEYLCSLGDDHVPVSRGWDTSLMRACRSLPGPGYAYGNDLFQGKWMPTAWVQHVLTYRALGWMMLPELRHMYVDNVILALGRAAERIVYAPDIIVEHRHPMAQKAAWDESYKATNATESYAADRKVFEHWCESELDAAVSVLRSMEWDREV
jgi:hypothetical protein